MIIKKAGCILVNLENKKIVGLYNSNNYLWATRDLKVDGIGIGSTFNEMYAKFVAPSMIVSVKDGLNDRLILMYYVQTKIRVSRI